MLRRLTAAEEVMSASAKVLTVFLVSALIAILRINHLELVISFGVGERNPSDLACIGVRTSRGGGGDRLWCVELWGDAPMFLNAASYRRSSRAAAGQPGRPASLHATNDYAACSDNPSSVFSGFAVNPVFP
jgi:hypothetical protein